MAVTTKPLRRTRIDRFLQGYSQRLGHPSKFNGGLDVLQSVSSTESTVKMGLRYRQKLTVAQSL
jgi:hypothetical protein